jgi:heat shock protein HspQ
MKDVTRQQVIDQLVFAVILFIPFLPLIVQIDPNYRKLIPEIPVGVFDHLIQISATILGFTLVGIFYHLGKVDEQKNDLISYLARKMANDDKYPDAHLQPEDQKRLNELVKTSKRVRYNMAFISVYFGLAIALSLICIIYFSNGVGQTWIFTIISLMLTPIYFFNRFWRDELLIR